MAVTADHERGFCRPGKGPGQSGPGRLSSGAPGPGDPGDLLPERVPLSSHPFLPGTLAKKGAQLHSGTVSARLCLGKIGSQGKIPEGPTAHPGTVPAKLAHPDSAGGNVAHGKKHARGRPAFAGAGRKSWRGSGSAHGPGPPGNPPG